MSVDALVTPIAAGALAFTVYWMFSFRPVGFPPGPAPIPFLGTFHKEETREEALEAAGKKYGPVFSVSFNGVKPVVIVNDFQTYLDDIKGHASAFANRPLKSFNDVFGFGSGIVQTNGAHWLATRKFALMALRENGMGKQDLVGAIVNEADLLTDTLIKLVGRPSDLKNEITASICNMVSYVVFGERYAKDSPELQTIIQVIDSEEMNTETLMMRVMMGYDFMSMIPKFMLEQMPFMKSFGTFKTMVEDNVEARKKIMETTNVPSSVVDMWLMEQAANKDDPFLSRMDVLSGSILDLFFAGIETTSMTLAWAVKFLAKYPSMQERLYAEIAETLGPNGAPEAGKQISKMPFFNAFLHEVMRTSSIAPQGVEHCTTESVKIGPYTVGPNTPVVLNQYGIHHDPALWKNPSAFDPSNFLDEDGAFKCPQHFLAFGFGNRVCIGQNLAKVEMFVFLARILQKFRVCAPEGTDEVDMSSWGDFLRRPVEQELVLELRNEE